MEEFKTKYDYMRKADESEEDAFMPEDIISSKKKSDREEYFDYYDDIKTSIKEDW